jgi:hypothetical protein
MNLLHGVSYKKLIVVVVVVLIMMIQFSSLCIYMLTQRPVVIYKISMSRTWNKLIHRDKDKRVNLYHLYNSSSVSVIIPNIMRLEKEIRISAVILNTVNTVTCLGTSDTNLSRIWLSVTSNLCGHLDLMIKFYSTLMQPRCYTSRVTHKSLLLWDTN